MKSVAQNVNANADGWSVNCAARAGLGRSGWALFRAVRIPPPRPLLQKPRSGETRNNGRRAVYLRAANRDLRRVQCIREKARRRYVRARPTVHGELAAATACEEI
ncbi:hypothetical protein MRX96_029164 [Rhipicephalus microplus]